MAFTYRMDSANCLIFTNATGFISSTDLENHFRHTMGNGACSYPQLIDARQATLVFTFTEAGTLASYLRMLAKKRPLGPVAIIVASGVNLAMVRILRGFACTVCAIEAFSDLSQAKQWLQAQKELVTVQSESQVDNTTTRADQ